MGVDKPLPPLGGDYVTKLDRIKSQSGVSEDDICIDSSLPQLPAHC